MVRSEVHNNRRFLKGGGDTFKNIVKGIDACLDEKIDVNLRMVIDRDNIDSLAGLALYAIVKRLDKKQAILNPDRQEL